MTLDQAIEAEAQAQAICMQHPDFRDVVRRVDARSAPSASRAPPPTSRTSRCWCRSTTPSHGKLGEELRARAATWTGRATSRGRPSVRLRELGVFQLLAPPPSVRALCVAREAIAYASPVADAIFAVQGLAAQPLGVAGAEKLAGAPRRSSPADASSAASPSPSPRRAATSPRMRADGASRRRRLGLDGEKTFISNVGIAELLRRLRERRPRRSARRASRAFLVEAGAPGLTLERIATLDDHPLGGCA